MSKTKCVNKRKKDIVLGRVKDLRAKNALTQAQFAESIDVSSNTISRIERGDMSLSSDVALKIADTYGVSLDWLFQRGQEILSPARRASMDEAFACMREQNSSDSEKARKIKLSRRNDYTDA